MSCRELFFFLVRKKLRSSSIVFMYHNNRVNVFSDNDDGSSRSVFSYFSGYPYKLDEFSVFIENRIPGLMQVQ